MMQPWDEEHWIPGVFSKRQMRRLIECSIIEGVSGLDSAADFSSIDLHLYNEGYRMKYDSIKSQI